ncbi:ABC transporter substrate-binding protein [Amorphus orientalis]|uniref:NitT/TauT family transport system substrate-binding protein n=1 Tax=Amorphus orientalis TaxID=649198 RepID=A0AAE3VRT3_9HYPH|nr:ABC transporter substrate-binding protein [Amorphus orientalis]MDQ0316491.1 NitT/TauT family transport system substrate-binding protein [Amorphus orientalis]
MQHFIKGIAAVAVAAGLLVATAPPGDAAEDITFLFPAPEFLPAFTPYQLAKAKGYYEDEGINVTFQVGKGGADVAKQVALGNAELGNSIGDTPIIVRANGLKVKDVAMLGGKALTQIIIRSETGADGIDGLKGKKIGVMSFQDTTYYNLLGALAAVGMTKEDVEIQAVGPAGVMQLMISGDLDAISGVPEWAAAIQGAGVDLTIQPINDLFPATAQAIVASDDTIADKPELVAGFVKGTLKALEEIMTDPTGASTYLAENVPAFEGKQGMLENVMKRYNTLVYPVASMDDLGKVDPQRLKDVQDFYVEHGIVRTATPLGELYTNEFVN